MNTYFGFAIADGMFSDGMTVTRKVVDVADVRTMIEAGVIPALNPTHEATINAMRTRYGLNVEIPEKAPMIKLSDGDQVIVMSVRGLPRREGGKGEYTQDEIDGATFEFSVWTVLTDPAPITKNEAQRLVNLVGYCDGTAAYLCYPALGPGGDDADIQFMAQMQERLGMESVSNYGPHPFSYIAQAQRK